MFYEKYFFRSFLEIWKWMAVLLSQRIIRVDSCLLIRYLAMHALSNDQTFNQSWSLSAVGELELVLQYPKQVFSCEYFQIFKNTYFEEYLRMAAFIDGSSG